MKKIKRIWFILLIFIISLVSIGIYTFAATNTYELSDLKAELMVTGTGKEVTDKIGQDPPLNSGSDYSVTDNWLRTYDTMQIEVGSTLNNFSGSCDVKYTLTATVTDKDGNAYPDSSEYVKWVKDSVDGLVYVNYKTNVATFTETRTNTSYSARTVQLKLYGAHDRDKIKISVKAEIVGSTAANGTKTVNLKDKSGNDAIIKVSAATLLNTSTVDFYNYVPVEYTLNGVKGRIVAFNIGIAATRTAENEGTEFGIGLPSGDITLNVCLKTYAKLVGGATEYPRVPYTIMEQKPNGAGIDIELANGTVKNILAVSGQYPFGYEVTGNYNKSLTNSGTYYIVDDNNETLIKNTTVIQEENKQGVDFTIKLKDWKPTVKDKIWSVNADTSRKNPLTNKIFSTKIFYVFVPYSKGDGNYDQYTSLSIKSIEYSNSNSDTLTEEKIPYNTDSSKTDNVINVATGVRLSGSYSMQAGIPNNESDDFAGDAKVALGVPFVTRFYSFHKWQENDYDGFNMIGLFEGDTFELSQYSDGTPAISAHIGDDNIKELNTVSSYNFKYGVGNINSDYIAKCADVHNTILKEGLVNVTYDDPQAASLTWYDTYEEAVQASANTGKYICGVKVHVEAPMGLPSLSTNEIKRLNLYLKLIPKTISDNVGKSYALKGFVEYLKRQDNGTLVVSKSLANGSYRKTEYNGETMNITVPHNPTRNIGATTVGIATSYVGVNIGRILNGKFVTSQTNLDLGNSNELELGINADLRMADDLISTDSIPLTCEIPSTFEFASDSIALYDGDTKLKDIKIDSSNIENKKDTKVLKIDLKGCGTTAPKLRFKVRVPYNIDVSTIKTNNFIATIDTATDLRPAAQDNKKSICAVGVTKSMKVSTLKSVNKDTIFIGDDFEYTITAANTTNDNYNNLVAIDNLPENNDANGSKFSGTYSISGISVEDSEGNIPRDVNIYFSANPVTDNLTKDNINTVGTWTLLTNANKSQAVTAKAFKITKSVLNKNTSISLKIKLKTNRNKAEDVYANRVTCNVDGISTLLTPPAVETKVIGKEIKGRFLVDVNRDGIVDNKDTAVSNAKVQLLNKEGAVLSDTTTDKDGNYSFKGLALGEYKVKFIEPDNTRLSIKGDDNNNNNFHANTNSITDTITVSADSSNIVRNVGVIPEVNITKSVDSSFSFKGRTRTFTIKVSNPSDYDVSDVSIKDTIPSGFTVTDENIPQGATLQDGIVTINVGNLKAKEEKSYEISGIITQETGTLTNTAKVFIGTSEEGSASAAVGLLTVTKSVAGGLTKIAIGKEFSWNIVVSNTSDKDVTSPIPVKDTLYNSLQYIDMSKEHNGTYNANTRTASWSINNIPAKGSVTLTVKTKVLNLNGLIEGNIKNVALVYGQIPAESEITIVSPKFTIEKTTSTNSTLSEGAEFDYVITIKNTGATSGSGTFEDKIPDGLKILNCSNKDAKINGQTVKIDNLTLAENETSNISIKVKVDNLPSGVYTKTFKNKAKFDNLTSNEVSNTVNKGELVFEKVASVDNLAKVNVGDEITYTIKYSNRGVASINDINIVDIIPEGTSLIDAKEGTVNNNEISWSGLSVAASESKEVSFTVKVDELPKDVYSKDIVNTAKVNGMDTNTITNYVKIPHLVFSKEVDKSKAVVGDTITYTIKVKNDGSNNSGQFIITDVIPEGSTFVVGSSKDGVFDKDTNTIVWTVDSLAEGEEKAVTFQVTANELAGVDKAIITNKALVNNLETNEVTTEVEEKPVVIETSTPSETNSSAPVLPKTGILNSNVSILIVVLVIVVLSLVIYLVYKNKKNK